jgi:hypothetical protein
MKRGKFFLKTWSLTAALYEDIIKYHRDMKTYLSETEYEYMIWQEWKEGFARYVENLIRDKLKMERNSNVLTPPFERHHFYEIGSRYIEMLVKEESDLNNDMEKLFYKMKL